MRCRKNCDRTWLFRLKKTLAATINQRGNQTGTNMTTTAGRSRGDQAAAKMHLGEAMKTLQKLMILQAQKCMYRLLKILYNYNNIMSIQKESFDKQARILAIR